MAFYSLIFSFTLYLFFFFSSFSTVCDIQEIFFNEPIEYKIPVKVYKVQVKFDMIRVDGMSFPLDFTTITTRNNSALLYRDAQVVFSYDQLKESTYDFQKVSTIVLLTEHTFHSN